ncbi:MAG TPA: ABC transporter ATP-binding protein [Steroidobacteraceae bacterium]|nr:ABC transporter ATP-binding protein [Steroidobacteraceae bacterium]
MTAVVETQGLTKLYGRLGALRDLSIAVPEGSVFALMGASGAGKTTAIKILLNMIAPSSGRASILGADSRHLCPATLGRVGYVSENQSLPVRLRVADFFDYIRPAYPHWDRDVERRLREQLRLPPDRRIRDLSHGMRMKLALASALAFRPRLLVLDEPFTGLDALARDEIVREFLQHVPETSILISSHELDEIERLATHVAFLHEGSLLFQGTLAGLREYAAPLAAPSGPAAAAPSGPAAAAPGGPAAAAPPDTTLRGLFVRVVRGRFASK